MRGYDHKKIEKKWQQKWEKAKLYKTADKVKGKENFYLLTEFPYPSGNLHVGHWYAFSVPDILARALRMQGKNVLYPFGFDAFGLPAENAAIKNKLNPRKWTYGNMAYMKKQIASMGASFDWSRELATCDPEYYKWTQWQFLQFFKNNLAYRKETAVNWCPSCKTVLANEQVIDGHCERCKSEVIQKQMLQWNLKITDYADRLIDDLTDLDWPREIKESQRNWIGRSEGAEIDFPLVPDEKKYKYVILHGWKGSPDRPRFQYWKKELEKQGHEVIIPTLPNPDHPREEEQVIAALQATTYDENTILFGHSLGCVVAMKVLEKLDKPIMRLVLAGGFMDRDFQDKKRPFEKTFVWKFDAERIKKNAKSITILHDPWDYAVSGRQLKNLETALGVKAERVASEAPHYTGEKEMPVLRWLRPTMTVFTTRPDTLYGATYLVLSPEHRWVQLALGHKTVLKNNDEVQEYVDSASKKTELERMTDQKEKTGVRLEGVEAINPANGEKIPVYIADYVLAHYGTGAIMAVPAHDERDYAFAKKFNIQIKEVIAEQTNPRIADGVYRRIGIAIVENHKGEVLMQSTTYEGVTYHGLPGGGIDEGESDEKGAIREVEEETGYFNFENIRRMGTTEASYYNPIRKINRQALATCYALKLKDDGKRELQLTEMEKKVKIENFWVSKQKALELLTGKSSSSGEDATLYKRYLSGNAVYAGVGILMNSGEFDGAPSQEAKQKIIEKFGTKKIAYKLRDWIVSRQRYWGVPIPIIHCQKCGEVAVPDKDLPVKLPEVKDYLPEGSGKSPLAKVKKWVNVKCPNCKSAAQRETDTLDTFVDSSWYFLRYTDPKNKKKFADGKKMDAWMPVNLYSGGAEHTTVHVLYSRFWQKALYDLQLVKDKEPYTRRMNRSLILGPDGQKMSKSRGNVIDPDEVVAKLGADTVRMYLAFIGPYNEVSSYPWNPDGVVGIRRFLERVWRLQEKISGKAEQSAMLHKTIKKVGEDIHSLKFNTAIAQMMSFINEAEKTGISKGGYETLLQLLAPFAPHITEELWFTLGHKKSIHIEKWPKYDESKMVSETVSIAVQVNGKTRAQINVPTAISETDVKKEAEKAVVKWLEGKEIKRTIYVPGRIVNMVVT